MMETGMGVKCPLRSSYSFLSFSETHSLLYKCKENQNNWQRQIHYKLIFLSIIFKP